MQTKDTELKILFLFSEYWQYLVYICLNKYSWVFCVIPSQFGLYKN